MNDPVQAEYQAHLTVRLVEAGLEVVPMPFAYHKMPKIGETEFRKRNPNGDMWNPAYGYYVNFLQVKGLILFPTFSIPEDEHVYWLLRGCYPGSDVVGIECADLSMEGGLINCVTANYVGEN
jgi:agmatine/peptidylarginine deiminase